MGGSLFDALRTELSDGVEVDSVAATLFERRSAFLTPARAEHGDVQMDVLDRFQHGFDALELLSLLSREIAVDYEQECVADSESANDPHTLALRVLFWSGHLIVAEVLSLLRAGFSVGALARWRAIHEVATRAEFLTRFGGPLAVGTARRYLEHEQLREATRLRAMQALLRRRAPDFAFPQEVIAALDRQAAAATETHGHEFHGEYGWAHETLLAVSSDYQRLANRGHRPRGPTLTDLEAEVHRDLEDRHLWRLLAQDANAAVHATPRSVSLPAGDDELSRVINGPEVQVLAVSRVGSVCATRLLALLEAYTHPYPYEDDEQDEDELGRVRNLHVACSLAVRVEQAFLEPVKGSPGLGP